MRFFACLVLVAVLGAACGKKAAEAVADTVVECLLPCDVTAEDAPAVSTATDATATLPEAVTP